MLLNIKQLTKKAYLAFRKLILDSLSYILLWRNPAFSFDNLRTVLIIAPPRIGDVALASSVFFSLKSNHPDLYISVLANTYTADFLTFIKQINQIVVIEDSLFSHLKFLISKSRANFDLAIDLNFDYHLWTAVVAGLSGSHSIGYDIAGRGLFFDIKIPPPDSHRHATDIFHDLLSPLRHHIRITKPYIEIPLELSYETDSLLTKQGIERGDRVLLIHPGAHHPTQRWLPQYFSEIADKIIEEKLAKLVFIGGPGEKHLIESITSLMNNSPDASFLNLEIKNIVALIKRADLLICNNSGPLHIALAANTPTISTLGPTVKERWMPIGDIHKVFRIDDLQCIGCNLGYCRIQSHDCMRLITPSIVLDAIRDFISNNSHSWNTPSLKH